MQNRLEEINTIWKTWRSTYEIGAGLLLVLIGVWIGSVLFATDAGYETNLYTEALGVLVTIAVLNTFARQREHTQLQQRLIREARSRDNSTAVSAVDWMHYENWLSGADGLLKEARLYHANLEDADFGSDANLTAVDLRKARLINANFSETNLTAAKMSLANLAGAKLYKANLTDAKLYRANLSATNLYGACLAGAILRKARLRDASINKAIFSSATVLPDAAIKEFNSDGNPVYDKYWTADTDMTRYTNPDHPDFWQPD